MSKEKPWHPPTTRKMNLPPPRLDSQEGNGAGDMPETDGKPVYDPDGPSSSKAVGIRFKNEQKMYERNGWLKPAVRIPKATNIVKMFG